MRLRGRRVPSPPCPGDASESEAEAEVEVRDVATSPPPSPSDDERKVPFTARRRRRRSGGERSDGGATSESGEEESATSASDTERPAAEQPRLWRPELPSDRRSAVSAADASEDDDDDDDDAVKTVAAATDDDEPRRKRVRMSEEAEVIGSGRVVALRGEALGRLRRLPGRIAAGADLGDVIAEAAASHSQQQQQQQSLGDMFSEYPAVPWPQNLRDPPPQMPQRRGTSLFAGVAVLLTGIRALPAAQGVAEAVLEHGGRVASRGAVAARSLLDSFALGTRRRRRAHSSQQRSDASGDESGDAASAEAPTADDREGHAFASCAPEEPPPVVLVSDRPHRTATYLVAVAAQVPLVHYNWVLHSVRADRLLGWRAYVLPAARRISGELVYHYDAAAASQQQPQPTFPDRNLFLAGLRLAVFAGPDHAAQERWETIASVAGAQVCSMRTASNSSTVDAVIVVEPKKSPAEQSPPRRRQQRRRRGRRDASKAPQSSPTAALPSNISCRLVSTEWLVQSVVRQSAVRFSLYPA